MSKTAGRKAKQMEFLGTMLSQAAEKTLQAEKEKYEPPPYKHGFIVKPTNPGWIAGLERKVRQYKERLQEQSRHDKTKYQLLLLETILRDGEVNVEAAQREFKNQGGRLPSLNDYYEAESIVRLYCRRGGEGVTSYGGFLPADSNYDETI